MSKGLFEGEALKLKGLPWCKVEEKTIGLESASTKILCKAHNSMLSKLDDEAKRSFEALRAIFSLRDRQLALRPRAIKVRTWKLDGRKLERWFLKTLINLNQVQTPALVWPGGAQPGIPTRDVVEACFGRIPIAHPMGLYGAAAVGHKIDSHDYVSFAPIMRTDRALAGGAFEFRGFRFVLSWTERSLQPFVTWLSESVPDFAGWKNADLMHPFRGINFTVGKLRSQSLQIVWPPFKAEEP